MLGRSFTSKSKAPLPTLPLHAAKGGLSSSASADVSTKLAAPVVLSHARQRLYPQIESTPPNPPLACGKGRAQFIGIGRCVDEARRSGSAEPCSAGLYPHDLSHRAGTAQAAKSTTTERSGAVGLQASRTVEPISPTDTQASSERMHRRLRGLRRSHKPDLPSGALECRPAHRQAAAEHGSALPTRLA